MLICMSQQRIAASSSGHAFVRGGVMVFDDYGFPSCRGEKDAVDEFFCPLSEKPICLLTGQALVIKV
jgi:hypothetical protein